VNALQPALKSWDISGLHAENPAKLVRNQQSISTEIPLPPAKMRDPLRFFHPGYILAQLSFRLPEFGDVLQHAELAQRLPRVVPRHVAPAVDDALGAVRPDHPVFYIVARTAAQSSCRCLGYPLPVLGVNQIQPALVPFWDVSGLHPKNSAKLVGKQHATGGEVPLPPAKMRYPLRLFQPGFILAQLIHCLRSDKLRAAIRDLSILSPPLVVFELSPPFGLYSFRRLSLSNKRRAALVPQFTPLVLCFGRALRLSVGAIGPSLTHRNQHNKSLCLKLPAAT
jgi:hypothetical protein